MRTRGASVPEFSMKSKRACRMQHEDDGNGHAVGGSKKPSEKLPQVRSSPVLHHPKQVVAGRADVQAHALGGQVGHEVLAGLSTGSSPLKTGPAQCLIKAIRARRLRQTSTICQTRAVLLQLPTWSCYSVQPLTTVLRITPRNSTLRTLDPRITPTYIKQTV